jgi:hypothetical protein
VNFVPDQHHRIEGTVGLMALLTATGFSRWMFKSKGPSFVYVATDTAELGNNFETLRRAFRIGVGTVAVQAGHSTFQYGVVVGLSKICFGRPVTTDTEWQRSQFQKAKS